MIIQKMNCNICYTQDVNVYKCGVCSIELCGTCCSLIDDCPQCRNKLKVIDKDCPTFKMTGTDIKDTNVLSIPECLQPYIKDVIYSEEKDKYVIVEHDTSNHYWRVLGIEYEIEGIKKPKFKYVRIVLNTATNVVISDSTGTGYKLIKQHFLRKVMLYSPALNELSEIETVPIEFSVKFKCDHCEKVCNIEGWMKHHIRKKHL